MNYQDWLFNVRTLLAIIAMSDEDKHRFSVWFDLGLTPEQAVERYMVLMRGMI